MNQSIAARRGFEDLVPWADPYIVALVEKVRRDERLERSTSRQRAELPPPLDNGDPDLDGYRRATWSHRQRPNG
jgi:hypothetical protein